MFVFAKGGLKKVLDEGCHSAGAVTMKHLRLFSNNHTPDEADVVADYTEVAGSGYAEIDLTTGGWNAATYAGGVATKTHDAEVWTFTFILGGSVTIHGYYIVDAAGELYGAELRAGGPVTLNVTGDTYAVTLSFDLDNV